MRFDYYLRRRLLTLTLRVVMGVTLLFLAAPLVVVIPLSFNSASYLTFPMAGFSTRWYLALFTSAAWQHAFVTSFLVAIPVTALATALGTLAALGLTRADFPFKAAVIALLVSPMMVPHIIVGIGLFLLYAWVGLVYTLPGMILAHTVLAAPFVVVTVMATLAQFNANLIRAGASLGAGPLTVFVRVVLPIILPGVLGGAVLAFVASFDELIVALMISGADNITLPQRMWAGVHEDVSPIITAASTLLMTFSVLFMVIMEGLRRRGERLRAMPLRSPSLLMDRASGPA
jgi:putative spermidine/putrescine transport system permease protein